MRESLRSAAEDVARELRLQADSDKWGEQEAVAAWLRILAERLDAARLGKAWGREARAKGDST